MNIWVKCMYVYGVWMCVRVFWSAQALYGETNALYRKCIKRQNSMHLTLLKHHNTKTSLYKLSKNNWVITLLEILGSVRRQLQSTVSLDHPVLAQGKKPSMISLTLWWLWWSSFIMVTMIVKRGSTYERMMPMVMVMM